MLLRSASNVASLVEEDWVKVDGRWYKVYEPTKLPFQAMEVK
jgi:hypothetical protein